MRKGDDPTDPGSPPDAETGPAPEPAPRPVGWDPPVEDPEIVAMLKGFKDSTWAPQARNVPTTNGELAAKWASDAREAPAPLATPTPEPNVVVWRTGDGSVARERPSEGDAAERGVERAVDRTTLVLPGRGRRTYAGVVLGAAALIAVVVALLARPASTPEHVGASVTTATMPPSPAPLSTPSAVSAPSSHPAAPASAESPMRPAATPPRASPSGVAARPRPRDPVPPAQEPVPAQTPAPGRDPSNTPF